MRTSFLFSVGLLAWLAACGPPSSGPLGQPVDASMPAPTAIVEVQIADALTFNPATVTVPRGAAVRWTNSGTGHTVTSGASAQAADNPGSLFDQNLARGTTFQFTFTTAGNQPYFCRIHERMNMKGLVIVTP